METYLNSTPAMLATAFVVVAIFAIIFLKHSITGMIERVKHIGKDGAAFEQSPKNLENSKATDELSYDKIMGDASSATLVTRYELRR